MKSSASFAIVCLAVTVVVALAPTAALAGRSGARLGGGRGSGAPIAGAHFGGPGALDGDAKEAVPHAYRDRE